MTAFLDGLQPKFRSLFEILLSECRNQNIPHVVTSTIRTTEEQQAAFKRGASKCDGIKNKSNHQLGLAGDICSADERGHPSWDYAKYAAVYKAIGSIARELGLECGQDWYPSEYAELGLGWDPPHYEWKNA